MKKILIFLQKSISTFQETDLSYIFLRKVLLLESYIQNPGILRSGNIFRTVVYSEPKAYSEHCQILMMKRFAKVAN